MADIFGDGFGRYGIAGQYVSFQNDGNTRSALTAMLGYWTTLWNGSSSTSGSGLALVAGRFAGSVGLKVTGLSGSGTMAASKTLPGNYARVIFGIAFQSDLSTNSNIVTLSDAGTAQVSVNVNTAGQIEVRRGGVTGTVLGTSVSSVTANTWHYLEGDITINNSTGAAAIDLDGVATSINLTGQNTRSTTDNYANQFQLGANGNYIVTDLYVFDNTGAANNAMRGDSRIETFFANADSSVHFTLGAALLGAPYFGGSSSAAPGANELVLRPFKTGPSATLGNVRLLPAASSAGANFKAVLYNDNGSGTAPSGAPIATGTQVTGCTSGTTLVLPFASGQALSAATTYWIGFITDTSVALWESDTNALGYKAANTYGSGAPTSPSMTGGQASWMIWGNLTTTGANWWQVGQQAPAGSLSYNQDSTVSDEDLFSHAALSSTPQSIAWVKCSAYMQRSDAGARSVSLRVKSGTSDSGGSSTGQTPSSGSFTFLESYFDTDPNTSAAWLAAAVNAAAIGYKVDS